MPERAAVGDFVPVIDLSGPTGRAALAETIATTCARSGFLIVVGHGVDQGLVHAMYDTTLAFFRLPLEEKQKAADIDGMRGWRQFGGYVAASIGVETPPDLCELLCMNRLGEPGVGDRERFGDAADALLTPNVWPGQPASLRTVWLDYYAAMEALATELMRLFALGLGMTEKYFDDKIDDHMTNMCANYYYPQSEPPQPGQFRKGPHTDWGSLTILYQDDAGGLQVQHPTRGWEPVAFVPGSFVINIGDLMAHWTGGQWVSTMHRVLSPLPERRASHRVSIAFFHQPNYDAVIEPLLPIAGQAAAPSHITSGGWIAQKMAAAYG